MIGLEYKTKNKRLLDFSSLERHGLELFTHVWLLNPIVSAH